MDSAKGVISQVIVAGKASGLGRAGEQTSPNNQLQYVANVGLKVNHKLGGHNMRIRGLGDSVDRAPPMWSTKPTMLIGIDVSHPQSGDPSEPSIAGIVASMDKYAACPCRLFVVTMVVIVRCVPAPFVCGCGCCDCVLLPYCTCAKDMPWPGAPSRSGVGLAGPACGCTALHAVAAKWCMVLRRGAVLFSSPTCRWFPYYSVS